MPQFEPFDVVCIVMLFTSALMMSFGAAEHLSDLFSASRDIVITILSAYLGKKWSDKSK